MKQFIINSLIIIFFIVPFSIFIGVNINLMHHEKLDIKNRTVIFETLEEAQKYK